MNLNSFKRNRKALTALLICTGFIAAHPLAAFAEENVPAVQMVQQQKQSVSGVVKDSTGEPVIGANIREKGNPSNGTITDIDGNFSIKVNPDATLEISFIGYKTVEVKAVAGKPLNVILKDDSEMLEEVVVVGYGTMRKKDLTGSVVQIRPDKLANEAPKTVQDVLRGTPGLNIGYNADAKGGGTMMVRGQRSVYVTDKNNPANDTHNTPLIILDGMQFYGELSEINPEDIGQIDVLKDASAAAIYGAKGANGVIVVTTKKGKMGAPRISYSGSFGFTDEVSRPKMLNAYQYGRLYNAVTAADPTNTSLNKTTALFQADELEAMKGLNYDLLDKYWETGMTQKHSVNVSGLTDKVNYFAGISYFDQDGNLGKLNYNRWNYRAGVDVKVSKWLGANLTVSGDYATKEKPLVKVGGSGDEKDYNLLLTRPTYMPESVNGYDLLAYGPSNTQKNQNQQYNFATLQNNGDYRKNMNSNLNISGSLDYDFGWSKILKGLKLRFSYSKSINTDKGNEYGSNFTLYQMLTRYGSGNHLYTPTSGDNADFDYLAASNFNGVTTANGDYLARTMVRTDNYQMNFTAQYQRDFGQHHLGGLFSIEKSEAESEYLQGQRLTPYPFTTGQYNSATGEMTTMFTRSESGTLSYIGRINYAYANKYLFEALVRSDASTKFAPKNYWGTFPAFSAGWVISEESWFRNKVKGVDFLKLRASWGMTGRDNTAAWQWMQVYAQDANRGTVFETGKDSGNRITINKNNSAVNSDVHWDKDYKTNVGIDAQFLNNRLAVTFDYYYEKNREMLMNIKQTVPSTVGTQSAASNIGEMDSWGGEFSVTWKDKIGKDFKYRIGINTGWSDNKVLNMDWVTDYLYRQITPGHRTDVGLWGMQCIGMFRSFQDIEEYFTKYNISTYMGLTKDQVRPGMLMYKDVRGAYDPETGTYAGPDGVVDVDNDQVELGHRSSNLYGLTMNLGADWKGLSLTAQIGASWGGYATLPGAALKPTGNLEYCNMPSFWNPDNMYVYQDVYDGSGNLVVKENREAYYPNLKYTDVNAVASSFWRVSTARVALNRLTLAYTLPKSWLGSIGINNCRINITGQNLINFYNPYPDNFMNPMSGSYGSYPNLRKWTVGVNLSF